MLCKYVSWWRNMQGLRILLSGVCEIARLRYYIDAVESFGAEAVAEYLPRTDVSYDGLILCGGGDIDPRYYGETVDGSIGIDNARDEAEFALLRAYIDAGKPILGICRGHQLINVYFGGSLYQHIPEVDAHQREGIDIGHLLTSVEHSLVRTLYGTAFYVNSSHHQALKQLGVGLRATAYWNNRYIEALEHTELPIMGVQWHPERMLLSQKGNGTVSADPVFACFLDACGQRRSLGAGK